MQSMDNTLTTLEKIKNLLEIEPEKFIGMFLYGSQNYGLANEHSDVDCIVIIDSAPTAKREVETELGVAKIYTLKHFIYRLKKGDLQCFEALCTKHRIVNPIHENAIDALARNIFGVIDTNKLRTSLIYKLDEHLHTVLWLPSNKDGARYNKKRLYQAIRVCDQLQRLEEGESFASSLVYIDRLGVDLAKIKTETNYLSISDFKKIYKCLVDAIRAQAPRAVNSTPEEEACYSRFYSDITKKTNSRGVIQ